MMKRFFSKGIVTGAVAALCLTVIVLGGLSRATSTYAETGNAIGCPATPVAVDQTSTETADIVEKCDPSGGKTGSMTIYANVHNCPVGMEVYASDMNQLASNCHDEGADGVTLTLHETASDQTSTTQNGMVSWSGLTASSYVIDEAFPAGFVRTTAFCNLKNAAGDESGFQQYAAEKGQVNLTLKEGYDGFCDLFNLRPDSVSVSVIAYECRVGVDPGKPVESKENQQQPDCSIQSGVTFSLIDAQDDAAIRMTTDATGLAYWGALPDGYIKVVEIPVAGYATPVVYCRIGAAKDQPANKPLDVSADGDGPTINFAVRPGDRADCAWYNVKMPPATPTATTESGNSGSGHPTATPVPSGKATFTLVAHQCKPGYNVFASSAKPRTDCPDVAANVRFTLTGGANVSKKQQTDDAGQIVFDSLKPGDYNLTLTFPAGITSAFIDSCTSNLRDLADYPFTPFARVGTSGLLGVHLEAGEQLSCDWFNVPPKKSASSATGSGKSVNLTIKLRECGAQTASSQCPPSEAGVQFSITPDNDKGAAATFTTDAQGVASGQAAPGTYTLAETGSTWCVADSKAFDADQKLILTGSAVNVTIYNCQK